MYIQSWPITTEGGRPSSVIHLHSLECSACMLLQSAMIGREKDGIALSQFANPSFRWNNVPSKLSLIRTLAARVLISCVSCGRGLVECLLFNLRGGTFSIELSWPESNQTFDYFRYLALISLKRRMGVSTGEGNQMSVNWGSMKTTAQGDDSCFVKEAIRCAAEAAGMNVDKAIYSDFPVHTQSYILRLAQELKSEYHASTEVIQ